MQNERCSDKQTLFTTFYLGEVIFNSTTNYGTAKDMYLYERKINAYNDSIDNNWNGIVGLIYPSDYVYTYANGVNESCYNNIYTCNRDLIGPSVSWLYKDYYLMISPNTTNVMVAFNNWDFVIGSQAAFYKAGIRPVIYLKSDIKIIGSGTNADPYVIVE